MATWQVYLLHFETPVADHARHYLGATKHLPYRIHQHMTGEGSPLVRAAVEAGIPVHLAAMWEGGRDMERRLKNRHNSPRFCPICQAETHVRDLMGGEVA